MSNHIFMAYHFICLVIGLMSFGIIVMQLKKDTELLKGYLLFYGSFTVIMFAGILLYYSDSISLNSDSPIRFSFQYMESFVGRYGLMFTWPYFVHRLVGITSPRADVVILGVVLVTFGLQHITEFYLNDIWDDRGDIFEDLVSSAISAYTLWLIFKARNFFNTMKAGIMILGVTTFIILSGIIFDLFVADNGVFRIYPLWYCITGVILCMVLIKQYSDKSTIQLPEDWKLSSRESEVYFLIQNGISNKEIARNLDISVNTVKTHMRSIFHKTGIRTRVGLIAFHGQKLRNS